MLCGNFRPGIARRIKPDNQSMPLKQITRPLVDGENNRIICDVAYSMRGMQLPEALTAITQKHGNDVLLLPLSGQSGGGGIFQRPKPGGTVAGLLIEPAVKPKLRTESLTDLTSLGPDEIVVDLAAGDICAGASITLNQLNRALEDTIGAQFKVLGSDLTSYTYAQVGATFMTGGMGPQRRYFSDSVTEIAFHSGEQLSSISGDHLKSLAGTYGWSGLVTAVRCRFHRLPANEIAFAIPVNNDPEKLSELITALAPFCYLRTEDELVVQSERGSNIILGLEHITLASMQPMLAQGGHSDLAFRADQLIEKCREAAADGIVFVNGYSDKPVDEFLFELVDDSDASPVTIAGINLGHTEVFNDPEQMRALREAVPYAARTQEPDGIYSYKAHTDAVIRLNPERAGQAMERHWRANMAYVRDVNAILESVFGVSGQLLVYGHINPYGVDPHNRLTVASDDELALERVRDRLEARRDQLLREWNNVCITTGSEFIGGEKGAGSEQEMFPAFGKPHLAPAAIRKKYNLQSEVIRSASKMFNWRAMPPYV